MQMKKAGSNRRAAKGAEEKTSLRLSVALCASALSLLRARAAGSSSALLLARKLWDPALPVIFLPGVLGCVGWGGGQSRFSAPAPFSSGGGGARGGREQRARRSPSPPLEERAGEEAVTPGSALASLAIALVPLSPALSPRCAGGEREKPVGRRGRVWISPRGSARRTGLPHKEAEVTTPGTCSSGTPSSSDSLKCRARGN